MAVPRLAQRWCALIAALLVAFCAAAFGLHRMTQPGTTQPVTSTRGPLVVVAVPRLTWEDVSSSTTPGLWGLVGLSAIGGQSVRATSAGTCANEAWLSLGAGTGSSPVPCSDRLAPSVRSDGSAVWTRWAQWRTTAPHIGSLGASYGRAHACVQAVGPGAALAAADADGRVARYAPSLAGVQVGSCPLTIIDLGAGSTESILDQVAAVLPENADLVVTGLDDSDRAVEGAAARERVLLMAGPDVPIGSLYSASTRQPGFVQAADLSATMFARVTSSMPDFADGQPLRVTLNPSPQSLVPSLRDRDLELRSEYAAVGPVWSVWAAGVVALVVFAGMLTVRRRSIPRWVDPAATWWTGFPAGAFLAGLVPWWRLPASGVWLFVVCGAWAGLLTLVAYAGPWRRHRVGPPAVVCGLTWLVLALDVCSGSRLQFTSTLGLQPLVGGRYFGMGNVGFGLFATACLLGAGLAAAHLIARGERRLAAATVAVAALVTIVVDALPGADFGGPPPLLVGAAVICVLALGDAMSWRKALLIAGGAVLLALIAALADWSRPPASRTHLGRFVQSVIDGNGVGLVWGKLAANLRMLIDNPLNPIIPIALVLLLVAALRPDSRAGRMLDPLWRMPFLREVCIGLFVCWAIALLLNDSGVAIPAIGGMLAVPLAVALIAAGRPSPRMAGTGETVPSEPGGYS